MASDPARDAPRDAAAPAPPAAPAPANGAAAPADADGAAVPAAADAVTPRPESHEFTELQHRTWTLWGRTEDATTQLSRNPTCVFCRIVAGKAPARFVYEDDVLVAFWDRTPFGVLHYQVIPKHHIKNINALRPQADHIALLERMVKTGHMLMARDHPTKGGEYKLVFHRPPFNSVNHLHMHCIALPLRPGRTWMKHDSLFFWTILAEQQLAKLVAEHQKASTAAP